MSDVIVAIDIGGTKTLVGLVTPTGEIIEQIRFPTFPQPDVHFNECILAANICLQKTGISTDSLMGIGVSVPGLADARQGILLHAPYLGWRNIPVAEILRNEWPHQGIKVANDVNACAHGELVFGRGKNCGNLVWVTISTGIGAGVIMNNQIYEGEGMIAGELGHLIVEWDRGRKCKCGNVGCLEAHASGTAIAEIAHDKGLQLTAAELALACYEGVETAIEIYQEAGMYLGRALSCVANLLNPGLIVVGGGVSLSFDLLEKRVKDVFQRSVMGSFNKNIQIIQTSLGYEAGLLGAASLVAI